MNVLTIFFDQLLSLRLEHQCVAVAGRTPLPLRIVKKVSNPETREAGFLFFIKMKKTRPSKPSFF